MTHVGPWTCSHYGCLKHRRHALSDDVGHACCGRCSEGKQCEQQAWGHAPLFPHPYEEALLFPGRCSTCQEGPH